MAEEHEPLTSSREVSEFLGIPQATLAQWRHRRIGPRGYRVGRHVKYRMSEVETWLQQRADEPQPAA